MKTLTDLNSSPICPLCESCQFKGRCDIHKRIASLEANVADHESVIGRMVVKLKQMWGGKVLGD